MKPKQAALTAVFGTHAELLDRTFTSFAQNEQLELHAFVVGDALPQRRLPGITYHLRPHDPAFCHIYRDINYRRWAFLDEIDAQYALVVDALDALCLQRFPEIPELLSGAHVAACVEHNGGRYMFGPNYTSTYLNAGVTFWNIPGSQQLRAQILERGRARYRALTDDQLALNEVIHANFSQLRILPCQYNYRAFVNKRYQGWPTCANFDGVKIYHQDEWYKAKAFLPVKPEVALPPLEPDPAPPTPRQQFWRRIQHRLKPHFVK